MRNTGFARGLVAAGAAAMCGTAAAGSFELFGLDGSYQLQGTYAAAIRLEDPDSGIVATGPSPNIPLPDFLKLPESNNYDDGDRNFAKGSLVNSRISFLGEFGLQKGDYGLLARGDAFYDRVYRSPNDNDSPGTLNKTFGGPTEFSPDAARFDGRRARLLDAYVYGSWYLGDEGALNLRVGRHIAAWGESLFFSGIALAQSPADATKATVPGADVKSILLPVNQVSMQLAVNSRLTVVGQYKLEFKETELNPVGEFFSVADILGPGAEFIWGIDNPLYLSNLADADVLSSDLNDTLETISLLAPAPVGPLIGAVNNLLPTIPEFLPTLNLPLGQIDGPFPGTPKYINVQRGPDIEPPDHGQYGVGVKYQVTPITNVGLFRLRYHNTVPMPVQNYGHAVLIPQSELMPVPITTALLGLQVPVTYNIKYFDGVDMTAMSFSTAAFGANIGGEVLWREGIPVLVDVDGGLLGPVPTPTRADVGQIDLNALYVIGPALFWDSVALVGNVGFIHVEKVEEACGPTSCSESLTYDRDAWAWATLAIIDKRNVLDGWDLQVPISLQGVGNGHSSLLSGFGSLMGEGDFRAGASLNFTYLQAFTAGLTYSGFIGRPDFKDRPYQDRDNLGITMTYRF